MGSLLEALEARCQGLRGGASRCGRPTRGRARPPRALRPPRRRCRTTPFLPPNSSPAPSAFHAQRSRARRARQASDLTPVQAAVVRDAHKGYTKATALPKELVQRIAKLETDAYLVGTRWEAASRMRFQTGPFECAPRARRALASGPIAPPPRPSGRRPVQREARASPGSAGAGRPGPRVSNPERRRAPNAGPCPPARPGWRRARPRTFLSLRPTCRSGSTCGARR
jgi:hypothetical protein